MRTTITIDDDLYRRAKVRSAQSGQPVSKLIEDAVREALRPRRQAEPAEALPVFGGSGVLPGVDLADGRSLREVMEGERPVDALR